MDVKNPQQVEEFTSLMTGIAEYYGNELSPSGIKVYMLGLQRFELPDLKRACSLHMQSPDKGQFMPKVADLIRIIEGDTGSQAGQAWVKADKALRIQGPYRDVCFDDPIIHRVIDDMGGWIHFCTRADENEYPFQQKEFERRYQGYAVRPLQDYPKLLVGMATHQNGVKGHSRRELPALIGDVDAAMRVYQGGVNPAQQINDKRTSVAKFIASMESKTGKSLAIENQSRGKESDHEQDA
ncbi:DUF6475 domain-containing protein [Endozoicomonas gorgoniicola]|uniref:DUF6475 domain-containing protein n=1 Tax=Endozoicomonas gorgoniicola TaxID=1234144 RepID=A0ABT3N5P3_9GAMM|nr:DUF6475 domain-containing protein [Endozoicomonas gorgoniicola]MCW7556465.1 DUF6475 domain-containing protein [Endozoicomonas gorgoniicola]MCW7556514.1 DUF6475 domain-containing protein [Endozoicomonas gorgoniicola]